MLMGTNVFLDLAGGVALLLTNGQARAASDQGSGAKDPHAMRAARA